jgi:hypothetical protein
MFDDSGVEALAEGWFERYRDAVYVAIYKRRAFRHYPPDADDERR